MLLLALTIGVWLVFARPFDSPEDRVHRLCRLLADEALEAVGHGSCQPPAVEPAHARPWTTQREIHPPSVQTILPSAYDHVAPFSPAVPSPTVVSASVSTRCI